MVCKDLDRLNHLIMRLYASVHGQTLKKYSPIIWNGESRSPMMQGNLLPRYELSPMVASFMQEEDEFQAKQKKAISCSQRTRRSLVIINILRPVPRHPCDQHTHSTSIGYSGKHQTGSHKSSKSKSTRMYELSNCGS